MLIYILLPIWFVISSILFSFMEISVRKKISFASSCLFATAVMAFRSPEMGLDTPRYLEAVNYYKTIGTLDNSAFARFEPGFKVLIYVSSVFPNSASAFLILSALLIVPIPFYVIYKISNNLSESYLLYYLTTVYFFNFGVTRQAIAEAFVCLAVLYSIKNNMKASIAFAIFAFIFHVSSIFVLPAIVLVRISPKRYFYIALLCASGLLYVFGGKIVALFGGTQYSYYSDSTYATGSTKLPWMFIVIFVVSIMLLEYIRSNVNDMDGCGEIKAIYNISFYLCMTGILISIIVLHVNLFYRINYYAIEIISFAIPIVLNEIGERKYDVIKIGYYLMYAVYFYLFLHYAGDWFGIFPYHTM